MTLLGVVGATGDAFAQATSTVVTSQENPSVVGQTVTLVATVTVTGPFVPGGTVDFFDGITHLGSSFVGAGAAIFDISSLTLGSHTITATYNGDTNGNLVSTSPPMTQIVILAPTTTSLVSSANPSAPGQSVTFTATVSGSGSPTGTVQFKDGAANLGAVALAGGVATFTTSSLATGSHTITAVYSGDSNNTASMSAALTQTVNQAVSTTTVTSSPNPSTPGQSVTFTATVTGASPTGTVQFKDGAANLGAVTLAGGVATFTTSSLATGGHSITAAYSGDANNTASTSAALTQTVNQAASTTTVTSSLNPSAPGQSVTFTATVTGASPTGTVQFKDGAANLGAAVTLAGGVATFTTSSLPAGSHSITAAYSGDTNNTASTSAALAQTVNQAASTTTVTSSLNPSAPGQSVTVTATVAGASPTGTVQFKDGAANLGAAVTLAGGVATFTTSSLATASHSITAVYSGDGNNVASTSAPLTQTVNKAATSTSLVSSLNPSTPGQSVTFTATVTGTSPTGTVQFKDGAANLGAAVTLAGGVATFTTSSLASGSHTITAVYGGDVNNTTSTSAELTQTVNKAATSTSLVSSLNPSTPGQSVTFTATVTGASPTGTVQFKDGAANLAGPVTLAGGVATFTTSSLASGNHSITAVYGGDVNNTPSTSAALAQSVNQSATTTTLSSSVNPSQVGQAVTFAATVTSGGGTPAGTVTFKDGAAVIGSATLGGGGVATLTISSLTLGSHSITAVYGGSAAFVTSTSAALIQAVSTPADSLKLRAMQTLAAPVVAQNSGAAISGAIDSAISEAFGGDGAFMTPTGSGMRINFAADPDGKSFEDRAPRSADPFAGINNSSASNGRGFAAQTLPGNTTRSTPRIDDAFGAMAYAAPTKAPPRYVEQRDWLGWAEVRGAVLDHWGTGAVGTVAGASMLYGHQVNLIAGLTRRLSSNFVVGVLGGYETFDYRSDALQGRLKGDGWTVGSYLGWKLTQTIRFDAAVSYSGIGYDGTAGTASGNFGGERWMVSSGLTGTYQGFGLQFEPSARIYALWEHESAYTDSFGTLQTARDFSTGRASAGVKVAYPVAWSSTVALAPYLGLYGDYYFNSDNATAALAASGLPGAVVLEGFSARAIGGVTARFANGGQVALGAEFGGIGGNASIWIYRARASVPF
ncbi:Ig-like domain repeat protein [Bradyrhizobium sp. B097]|uniref:Ig-like domain repeat protein n=1 Tax=Bradyrhizobium sp. B097 TaxID=3140244 RepID=UPI003182C258